VPEFGAKADAPVSAYLPASLDKLLGIYLLVRIATALFELTPAVYGLLMALGGLTLIGAVLMALVQHDLKRLLSYHAVSQVGYMVLGIGTGTAVGLAGALFHLLNNVIYKSALFLGAGAVEKGTGTTDLDRLGGLSRLMPVTFIGCTISALAISGIPPLNGFASKWMIYQGLIESGGGGGAGWIVWLAVAMLGSALTLASFVKVLHAAFLCKPSPTVEAAAPNDGPLSMRIPILLLASACVVFGVFAFAIPLQWLILPVAPVAIDGVWWAGPATLLIVSSIVIGLVVYRLSYGASGPRRVPTWVGGERLDSSHVSGAPRSPERHLEVSGTDFYRTIEDLPSLRRYYAWTRARTFDLYEQLRRAAGLLIQPLRSVHTGILPAYLRWFLAGLLVVVWVVTQSGS
jgi:formate hydrogenlyase subunit 3/multisubunit Na+/H+ antiporter MnhD subunit